MKWGKGSSRQVDPTPEASAEEDLWSELGQEGLGRRVEDFMANYQSECDRELLELPHINEGWPQSCPKCGLGQKRHQPTLTRHGGQEYAVDVRRSEDGSVELFANKFSPRMYYIGLWTSRTLPRYRGWTKSHEVIELTCECGHHLGTFRPIQK